MHRLGEQKSQQAGPAANQGGGSSTLSNPDNIWIMDSGAMNHISYDSGQFHDLAPCQPGTFVITGDGEQHPITHVGDIRLPISMGFLSLRRVFLVPTKI